MLNTVLHLCSSKCVSGFLQASTSVLVDTSKVSYNSTQTRHYLSGLCLRFHRLRAPQAFPPLQITIISSRLLLALWLIDYKTEIPMNHSSSLIHSWEALKQLKVTVYINVLVYYLIKNIERYRDSRHLLRDTERKYSWRYNSTAQCPSDESKVMSVILSK